MGRSLSKKARCSLREVRAKGNCQERVILTEEDLALSFCPGEVGNLLWREQAPSCQ